MYKYNSCNPVHGLAMVNLQESSCNTLLAMAIYITYEVTYESVYKSEISDENSLKIG